MRNQTPTQQREAGYFETVRIRVKRSPLIALPPRALLKLGYTKIQWQPTIGGFFTALDESLIPTVIVMDVSPVRDGYPTPHMSRAREASLERLCHIYLQEHGHAYKVRADYIALPDEPLCFRLVPLTHRRGVAWAHAPERARKLRGGDAGPGWQA